MPAKQEKITLTRLFHILGMVCFIALIVFVYILPWQESHRSSKLSQQEILLKIEQCKKMLTDITVSHQFQRQLNSLACFEFLATKNTDYNDCLDLDRKYQLICLAAFARVKSDLSICEKADSEKITFSCKRLAVQ
ncbi:MAG: hypothetical protein GF365_00075 [Candidatus Buchananbacteria bacterium]|nr:hypothetical protein [Candidatus Buchananbacteria bacterium]